jgi:Fe-S-cluster-containing hydrogenase component 2
MVVFNKEGDSMERKEKWLAPGREAATPVVAVAPKEGWGIENLPYPQGLAYIQARWDLCVGCGACELACAFHHFGVLNRELSRIRIYRYLTPLPKSVQNVCAQCPSEERECEKSCEVTPSAIYFDKEALHTKVDVKRCRGVDCGACAKACPAAVPHFYPPRYDYALVCDLCEKDGQRRPVCVDICPNYALEYMTPRFPRHLDRVHPDEKAESLSKRLYPLPKDKTVKLPSEIWGD